MGKKLFDVVTPIKSSLKLSDVDAKGEYPVYGASGLVGYLDKFQSDKETVSIIKDGAGIGRVSLLPARSSVLGTMQMLSPKEGINVSFLYYYLRHLNLGTSFTGSTIPHIYFKDYGKSSFRELSSEKQANIADNLSNIDKEIKEKEESLTNLDALVKSRFMGVRV